MKRLFAIIVCLLMVVPAYARWDSSTGSGGSLTITTVASLPAASSVDAGTAYVVTDGGSTSDCVSGGGTDHNICISNGTNWLISGDGTGGVGSGSMTTVEENNAAVGDADIVTLDFGVGLTASEDPDTEINIVFDATDLDAITWSDGANASNTWTFNVSGTNHTMVAGNGLMTFGDAVTVTDLLTATNGLTIATTKALTVGAVRWDDTSDQIDGEQIANDTIDDDSIDFGDVTGADLTLTDATTITASGLITASAGLTIATGQALTVGVVQWDDGSDAIDGEKIANDTIDDDSIDFSDVTAIDITMTDAGAITSSATITSSGVFDVTGANPLTLGSGDVTVVTITTDDTGDGTDLVLPAQSVNGSEMLNNTVTTTQLSAALTFANGDQIDLSGVAYVNSATTNEGIAIPTYVAGAAPADGKPYLAYDAANNRIMVYEAGGWADTSSGSGASDGSAYVTWQADGGLSAEQVLTGGTGISVTLAGGDGGNATLALDGTEIDAITWSDNANASNIWTFDVSGTNHTMTAGDGLMTFGDAVTVTDTLTATNGIELGTSKAITGTTGITFGGGSATTAIASSDWAIGATGIMTGIGNFTSNGTLTVGSGGITITDATGNVDGTKVADADLGDIDVSTGAWTLDTDVVAAAEMADADHGDISWLNGDATLDADVVAAAEMADADHGMVSWTSGEATVEDFALNADAIVSDGIDLSIGTTKDYDIFYDETTNDNLNIWTTAVAATATTTGMIQIKVNDGGGTLTDDQEVIEILNNTTELMSLDENGDLVVSGKISTAASADPYWFFQTEAAGAGSDTNWTISVDDNADGVSNDSLKWSADSSETAIQNDTSPQLEITSGGNFIAAGTFATTSVILEGGTYDTTVSPGTPTESVTYQWPLADGTSGQVMATDSNGVLSWQTVTATPAGANYQVQWNNGSALDAEAAFTYNDDNNSLQVTQAASNVALQTGDGSYSFDHTPQVGIEGVLEVDLDIFVEDDIYMDSDSAVLWFGEDADVFVTHDPDDGLFAKSAATTDNNPFVLTLQTGETDIAADDVIAGVYFQAPDEATGTDAQEIAAGIEAVSEGDFSAASNATKLSFKTGASETATEKMALSSTGVLTVNSHIVPDGANDATLGTDALDWADLWLGDGAKIDFDSGDLTLTHSAELLTFAGGAVDVDGAFTASTLGSDGAVTAATNVIIGDAGNIGSASDADSMAIAANGEVTLSQELQAGAGIDATGQTVIVNALTITAGGLSNDSIIDADIDQDGTFALTGAWTMATVDATTDFTVDGLVLTADTITNDATLNIDTGGNSVDFTSSVVQAVRTNISDQGADADDAYTATADDEGGVIINAADDDTLTITLPAAVAGMCYTVLSVEAQTITIDVDGSDQIMVLTNAAGDSIDSAGAAGNMITLCAADATEWYSMGSSGTWTDGD